MNEFGEMAPEAYLRMNILYRSNISSKRFDWFIKEA